MQSNTVVEGEFFLPAISYYFVVAFHDDGICGLTILNYTFLRVLDGNEVKLKTYEPTLESLINSWVERFPNTEYVYSSLLQLAERDREHFKY